MTQPTLEGTGHGKPVTLYASDGSDWYAILVDSDGHVKVDVVTTALPTGAATAANQATMITALQLIDDLRAALASVATDQLRADVISSALPTDAATQTTLAGMQSQIGAVGGGDAGTLLAYLLEIQSRLGDETSPGAGTLAKLLTDALTALQIIDGFADAQNLLFGYQDRWLEEVVDLNAVAPDTHVLTAQVPPGEIWILQAASAQNNMRGQQIRFQVYDGTTVARFSVQTSSAAGVPVAWSGTITLKEDDRIRVSFMLCTAGDDLYVWLMGYKMKIA